MKARILTILLLSTFAASCGPSQEDMREEVPGYLTAQLSTETKRARCDSVKNYASLRGLTNPVLVAGVANHETGLVQCWSENTIHCQGPASADCGGGPVLAGSGDGPCGDQQGGLGMFQFDSGTYSQTLASYGSDILNVSGNARQGVDTVIYKARVCRQFASDAATIAWMNTATPGTQAYEDFLTAMASCYNGCTPNLSCHAQRRLDYDAGVKDLLNTLGNDYWYNQDTMRSAPQRVARDAEGRITLVARSANGTAFFKRQSSAGSSTWTAWTSLGGTLVQDPVIARNSNGRLTAFGVGSGNALYINHQSSASAWTGWIQVGGSFGSHVAVGMNQDGRLEVFGRGTDNALWRTNQTSAGGTSWTVPFNVGGVLTSDPAVALDRNGYLNVFLVGTSGRFFRVQQSSTGWTGFLEMTGATVTSAPSVGINADGRLEVFARGSSNDLLHTWHQTTAANSWSAWASMSGVLTSAPSAGRNANNNIEVFVRNDQQGAHRIYQSASGWTGWLGMGGVIKGAPVPVNNSSGKLEIYAGGGEGYYRLVQLQTDGAWSTTWELLGQP